MEPKDLRYRRKVQAQDEYAAAAQLAAAAGLTLTPITEAMYELDGPKRRPARLRVNPSRCHIRSVNPDHHWPAVDGFDRDTFSLVDVVQAAIDAIERR